MENQHFYSFFCLLDEKKIVIYKEKHHGKCNIILYTLPELFCYVNRDMYLNKEWAATVSNSTGIKSTFYSLLNIYKSNRRCSMLQDGDTGETFY